MLESGRARTNVNGDSAVLETKVWNGLEKDNIYLVQTKVSVKMS